MKVFLLHRNRDFDSNRKPRSNEQALIQDLELKTMFDAMARGDEYLYEMAGKVVLSSLDNDRDAILFRQNVLKDCLKNSRIVGDLYDIALEAIESERKLYYGFFGRSPSSTLYRSIEVLQVLLEALRKLKAIAGEQADQFTSEGFAAFFAMLQKELGEEYLNTIQNHLKELRFRSGVFISAELGEGNKGVRYVLRRTWDKKQNWTNRIFAKKTPVYSFRLDDRDESGARALSEMVNRGINVAANALAQSADHILGFFNMLRTELSFYVGCLNLHEQLAQKGGPICFPLPASPGERRHSFVGLYDACLALTLGRKVIGNEMNADDGDLVIITGANQGGKSTFLRSLGLSQLMMQCGVFVPAESFRSSVYDGLFTHFKREEDATMKSGKLDEELSRMSDIIDQLTPKSMILLNESFAATNEREGSEIARQILGALLEVRIKVCYVTHLSEFARGFYGKGRENVKFLRAERRDDGARTYKIIEGEPLQTSYGEDLYCEIFGVSE